MKKAYGFRTLKAIEIALYHQLENLPEPEFYLPTESDEEAFL
jgi:hypothetical protein